MAGNSDPLGEFMQGVEACDEVHTFFDGWYARWNNRGPWAPPEGLTEEEMQVRKREMIYYRFGWWLCDLLCRAWAWLGRSSYDR